MNANALTPRSADFAIRNIWEKYVAQTVEGITNMIKFKNFCSCDVQGRGAERSREFKRYFSWLIWSYCDWLNNSWERHAVLCIEKLLWYWMLSFMGKHKKFRSGVQYEAELATVVYEGVGIECFISLEEWNKKKQQFSYQFFGVSEHWLTLNDWLVALPCKLSCCTFCWLGLLKVWTKRLLGALFV